MTPDEIRVLREEQCFHVVDRSPMWYDRLTCEQLEELVAWHKAWLSAPETGIIPEKPVWLE